MNRCKSMHACQLMSELGEAISRGPASKGSAEAVAVIEQACRVLRSGNASYKAPDYALARAHGHLRRLIGFGDLVLSDEAREHWQELDAFVLGPAQEDLRGVGGAGVA